MDSLTCAASAKGIPGIVTCTLRRSAVVAAPWKFDICIKYVSRRDKILPRGPDYTLFNRLGSANLYTLLVRCMQASVLFVSGRVNMD